MAASPMFRVPSSRTRSSRPTTAPASPTARSSRTTSPPTSPALPGPPPTRGPARADPPATKTDGGGTYTAGTNVSYTVTVNNSGPSDAQSVLLTDALPAGTTFVSLSLPAGWTRTDTTAVGANGTITATLPTLVAGA